MSTNPPPTRPKWGVGSFFQQAVAGVESRLDNILAEPDEELNSKNVEKSSPRIEQPTPQTSGMSFSRPISTGMLFLLDLLCIEILLKEKMYIFYSAVSNPVDQSKRSSSRAPCPGYRSA